MRSVILSRNRSPLSWILNSPDTIADQGSHCTILGTVTDYYVRNNSPLRRILGLELHYTDQRPVLAQ